MVGARERWTCEHEAHEKIGRYVKNAFGESELVYISRIWWAYLDWLRTQECDVDTYIAQCDEARGDMSFSDALQGWVNYAFEAREEMGLPRPYWLLADLPDSAG